jgi:hypothetical protein
VILALAFEHQHAEMEYPALRSAAEQFAREVMSKYDASHDFR